MQGRRGGRPPVRTAAQSADLGVACARATDELAVGQQQSNPAPSPSALSHCSPRAMCQVSGLEQKTQRRPQPCKKTRNRTPGPSTAEKDSIECTEPTTSGTSSGSCGRAVAKSKPPRPCRDSRCCRSVSGGGSVTAAAAALLGLALSVSAGCAEAAAAAAVAAPLLARPRCSVCRRGTSAGRKSEGLSTPSWLIEDNAMMIRDS